MTGTSFNQASNLIIGDDAAELLRLGSVGIVAGFGGNDTIEGVINGIAPGSTLFGGMGNDFLTSKGVGDLAYGGMGNDILVNESGQATQFGEMGNDTIFGEEDQNTVYGGAGNDSIFVAEDRNVVFGDDGNDTIRGGEGNDIFAGGAGNDYLIAAQTSDDPSFLFGNEGNDILVAGPNADSLYGGKGADSVSAGSSSNAGNMFLSGDTGGDTITYLGSGDGVILDGDRSASLTPAGTDAGADTFIVDNPSGGATNLDIFGGAGNDSLFGTNGMGLGANAEVFMGQGNDYFAVTSGGSSSFSGDLGNDVGSITAAGNDTIYGDQAIVSGTDASSGNDVLNVNVNGGANVIYGDDTASGAGNDAITTTGMGSSLLVGGGGNDTLNSDASAGGDTLVGGAGNDIYTFGADDVIPFDSLGNNTYIAGATATAQDTITVQANDSFTGGATFFVTGEAELIKTITDGGVIASDEKDLITIGTANALTSLAGGDDTLNATNVVEGGSIFGGAGNDVITVSGTDAAGVLDGGAGNDAFTFSDAAATVSSTIEGGAGDDTLTAAGVFAGSFSGGDGVDVFDIETLGGNGSAAVIDGGAGNELIGIGNLGSGVTSTVQGGLGDDTLTVGTVSSATPADLTISSVVLDGGLGNDYIRAGSGGNASLVGGDGDDILIGGSLAAAATGTTAVYAGDKIVGGLGNDTIVFLSTNDLGFIDTSVVTPAEAGVTDLFTSNSSAYLGSAGEAGSGAGILNNVFVDTITDFVSGSDKLFFNTDAGFEEQLDRKSTRLNSSHQIISYAVFCLKKKKINTIVYLTSNITTQCICL